MADVKKPRKVAKRQTIFVKKERRAANLCTSKIGETYRLGPHTVVCGDCTNPGVVGPLLKDAGAHILVATDPPYSSGARQEAKKKGSTSVGRFDKKADGATTICEISRDNLTTTGYKTLLLFAFVAIGNPERVREAYIFTDHRMWGPTSDSLDALGILVDAQIVWDKRAPGLGKRWRKRHELIAYAARGDVEDIGWGAGRPGAFGDVIQCKRDRGWGRFHPTPKPVDLMMKLIRNTDAPVVYDPFTGSGSTLIATNELGRIFYGCELEPYFCDLLRWRWALYAAKKGIEVGDGLPDFVPVTIDESEAEQVAVEVVPDEEDDPA